MAEQINKVILVTEYKTEGAELSIQKVTELKAATDKLNTANLAKVEADKKVEQAATQAGVAIDTETKKVNELSKAIEGTASSMSKIAQTNTLKDTFAKGGTAVESLDQKLKKFQETARNAKSIEELNKAVADLVDTIDDPQVKAELFKILDKEAARLEKILGNPVARLRELKKLIATEEDPKALRSLQLEAAKLQDELQDNADLLKALSSDTFFTDTLIEGVQTTIGAFTAFQGILSLTTEDQEKFAEATAKAQGALALLQGVQSVVNNLKKEDNIITRAQIAGQKIYTAVVGTSTGATKALRLALAATGIGLLVIGIAALVTNFDKLKKSLGGVNPELREYADSTKDALEATKAQTAAIQDNLNVQRAAADLRVTEAGGTLKARIQRLNDEAEIIKKEQAQRDKELDDTRESARAEQLVLADIRRQRDFEAQKAKEIGGKTGDVARSVFGTVTDDDVKEQEKLVADVVKQAKSLIEANIKAKDDLLKIEGEKKDLLKDSYKAQNDDRLSLLNETERNLLAISEIEQKSQQDILNIRLDFAKKRERILKSTPDTDKVTLLNAKNQIVELEREIASIEQSAFDALQQRVSDLRKKALDEFVKGSDEFTNTAKEYNLAIIELNKASGSLDVSEIFVPGSVNALQKQVSDLQKIVDSLPKGDELLVAVENLNKAKAELQAIQDIINGPEEVEDQNLAIFDEQTRHEAAMLQIRGESELAQLQLARDAAVERLAILEALGEATDTELNAQKNAILELDAQIADSTKKTQAERIQILVDGTGTLVNAAIDAAEAFLKIEQDKNDRLIELQKDRVSEAEKIADKGNVALLEAEQERLDELNKKREKFVVRQQQLAQAQLVVESILAIAKAASQGGAAAPFTIAATLIALATGIAQARAQAQSALSFRKGGVYDSGYTGDGPPDGQSLALGSKPYEYHYREHIMPHEVTRIGNNISWLEKIRTNKIDIEKMVHRGQSSSAPVVVDAGNHVTFNSYLNSKGIIRIVEESEKRNRKIENLR